MEDEKQETSQEESTENTDSLNGEVVEEESTDNVPTVADYEALKQKNKTLFERAKKAEEAAKKLKAAPEINKPNTEPSLSREEVVLLAKGLPEEDIEFLKIIQSGSATVGKPLTLTEAMNNPGYLALKKEREAKERKAKAQLGASGGSSTYQDLRSKVNMPEEEHRKLFEQSLKR